MFVSDNNIEQFVDSFLALPIFNDIQKRGELRDFMIDALRELYKEFPKDVENMFKKAFNISYITYAFAVSLGILPRDVIIALKYFIRDTIALFVKKGSFDDIFYLKNLLIPFGIEVEIYQVHVMDEQRYEGFEIETENHIIFEPDENMLTDIHLIRLEEYQQQLQEENYKTIVLYVNITNNVYFDHETLSPPVALQAYAFTRYKNESIVASFDNGSTQFHMDMLHFMKLFRYLYLKYIQLRNPGFDTDTQPISEMWFMVFDADQYLDDLFELCDDYLHNIRDRRDLDDYVRREAAFMNLNRITVGGHDIEYIYNSLYSQIPQILDYIDNNANNAEKIYEYLNEMRVSLITKLHALTYANDIEEATFKVFLYLINTVIFDVERISKEISDIFYVFKRYFLPIYATFKTKVDYVESIKNRLNKLYTSYDIVNTIIFPYESLVELGDEQDIQTVSNQEDWVLLEDSGEAITVPQWYEIVTMNDYFTAFYSLTYGGDLVEIFDYQDLNTLLTDAIQLQTTDNYENRSISRAQDIDVVEISSIDMRRYRHEVIEVPVEISDKYDWRLILLQSAEYVNENLSDNGTITVYNEDNTVKETDTF